MKKLPLKNTENKTIPIGSRISEEIRKNCSTQTAPVASCRLTKSGSTNVCSAKSTKGGSTFVDSGVKSIKKGSANVQSSGKSSKRSGINVYSNAKLSIVNSANAEPRSCKMEVPQFHTTVKLAKVIKATKKEDPNLSEIVSKKLDSPNTAKFVKTKVASKVTVPENKNVFKDLISADVNKTALVNEIEEDLRQRAINAQPTFKPLDPEPDLTEYYNEDVNQRFSGPSKNFLVPSHIKPFFPSKDCIIKYSDVILGKI